jgi:glycosyltransferase involved in cell wall biosynthesis
VPLPESSRTKIVRIIARLNVGGPAKHVVWLTAGLNGSKYQSMLVAGSVPDGEEDMSYFADQFGVVPFYIPEMSREISLKDVKTLWKLFRLFCRERPDIIHTHTAKAGTVGRAAGFFYKWFTPGLFLGRPRRCKFVHTYHGHIFHSYYGPAKSRLFLTIERALARLITDRLVVISAQQAKEIGETFGVGNESQLRIIPLGLDLNSFSDHSTRRKEFRRELRLGDDRVLVGIVGRLTDVKNHELFVRSVAAYKTLRSGEPPVKFVIIGDGSLRAKLEQQSQTLGLRDDIAFVGGRNDPEYFYPALDVVALTSRNEGTPLTLIEAMANARPVIATNVGGVVDLLGPVIEANEYKICERGLSVPPNDPLAFAKAMKRLINDKPLQTEIGERGFQFVRASYQKERLLDDIQNLYDELMDYRRVTVETPVSRTSVRSRI